MTIKEIQKLNRKVVKTIGAMDEAYADRDNINATIDEQVQAAERFYKEGKKLQKFASMMGISTTVLAKIADDEKDFMLHCLTHDFAEVETDDETDEETEGE